MTKAEQIAAYHPTPFFGINPSSEISFPRTAYCSNVYSVSSWSEILDSLETFSKNLDHPSAPDIPLGLGVWIPAKSAEFALKRDLAPQLSLLGQNSSLPVFCFNGFPHGNFHQKRVKEEVFSPDWTCQARLAYTLNLMKLATQNLKSGSEFGISTVPISWAGWIHSKSDLEKAALHLSSAISDAFFAEKTKNILLHIDLEPEPFGYLSSSQDAIRFFKEVLIPVACPELQRQWGLSFDEATEVVLDKVRICYDTCHAAVEFENPSEVLKSYGAAGLKIGRFQISSAPILHLRHGLLHDGRQPSSVLSNIRKDLFLHQVIGRDLLQRSHRYSDLPEALDRLEEEKVSGEFRVHLHIPIYLERLGPIHTTQNHILELLESVSTDVLKKTVWEIETYTWSILPEEFTDRTAQPIECGIFKEILWLHSQIKRRLQSEDAKQRNSLKCESVSNFRRSEPIITKNTDR